MVWIKLLQKITDPHLHLCILYRLCTKIFCTYSLTVRTIMQWWKTSWFHCYKFIYWLELRVIQWNRKISNKKPKFPRQIGYKCILPWDHINNWGWESWCSKLFKINTKPYTCIWRQTSTVSADTHSRW